ncbi:ATP-binding cassette domain-containing protein [Streptococcus suis]|uniref:Multidrug ABC transporter ATP-binding protein n=1 Tax=Streptococcus suis TaxID=1307 RepID=A0A2I5KQM0_STRSU|nr:ATP-binding cassette domain-containing protein [Streptococcus suis]AUA19661.1 multidrug ABC transporter ATP-binding protein [Streptococcus suis]MBY5014762.1 ATP-binding cassette domain-containing protein [Streptococcus suis]MBY5030843.1 ATP-binding cassette domain-containing protein [Streptococcus suis]MCL4935294.1 ATP-binding cassette domain-containing protein [Streptococcus suis]
MTSLSVKHICKSYKKRAILEKLSFEFTSGKIYGIVGPNGSGKTVLLKCLAGLESVNEGQIELNGKILGVDFSFLPSVGVIIETPGFLEGYSGYDNLKQLALIKNKIGKKEIKKSLQEVGLNPDSTQKVKHYSLGMKQKLALAQAFMEDPDILLLDEPMNGLDKRSVLTIREKLRKLKEEGKLIILASHIEQDIEYLCDQVLYLGQDDGVHFEGNSENMGKFSK